MIKVRFLIKSNRVIGFDISGHAGFAQAGSDIVCAAVSSAAYMTANTVTDVICSEATVYCTENSFYLLLRNEDEISLSLLEGLKLHLTELSKQYPRNIRIIYGGVTDA